MENKNTILIVEDERPLLAVIKKKLEGSGFDTLTARSVEQAKEYLGQAEKVNVIWLDHYLLGRENGLDFVTELKNEESKYKEIPVFVVSNTATQEKVVSYLQLGVSKYYTKADHRLDDIVGDIKDFLEKN
ncbi:response regulator [bacterium]|jgi:DNA-binding response OmpR family regulator|nr:response regulator [bacterium]MBT4649354.1 response regulator [bacterium]